MKTFKELKQENKKLSDRLSELERNLRILEKTAESLIMRYLNHPIITMEEH